MPPTPSAGFGYHAGDGPDATRMSGFADYEQYDGLGLAELVRRGQVSPGELLEAAIARVEARNGAVNAVTMKLHDYGRWAIGDGLADMMMDDVDEYWRRVFAFSPFTVWFNITGQPAIMLPLGHTAGGLPVAVQLVARYGDEATMLRLAAQLEAARPWFDRKPVLAS